jgi:hypothetical protein
MSGIYALLFLVACRIVTAIGTIVFAATCKAWNGAAVFLKDKCLVHCNHIPPDAA